jgi:hypothetical protein
MTRNEDITLVSHGLEVLERRFLANLAFPD